MLPHYLEKVKCSNLLQFCIIKLCLGPTKRQLTNYKRQFHNISRFHDRFASLRRIFLSQNWIVNPERNNEIFSKLRNPLKYPIPYSRTKKYQSFLNYALANFQDSMWFLFYCTFYFFHIANCLLCILYRVFLLYPRPTAHLYMYICRILLIQLLGCHIEINACLEVNIFFNAGVSSSAITCESVDYAGLS